MQERRLKVFRFTAQQYAKPLVCVGADRVSSISTANPSPQGRKCAPAPVVVATGGLR